MNFEKFNGSKKSKMKNSILCVAFSIAMLSACQNNSKSINQDAADAQDTIVHHEEQVQQASPVSLNNGKKWIANSETTEGIKKMTALMTEFTHQPEANDYKSLKVQLETEFNLILQKCTMTGEAHEQLHKYLIPMAEMFKKLNSEDMEVCHKAFDELKQHLTEYENYFQ
jgi:hypothetical protein